MDVDNRVVTVAGRGGIWAISSNWKNTIEYYFFKKVNDKNTKVLF